MPISISTLGKAGSNGVATASITGKTPADGSLLIAWGMTQRNNATGPGDASISNTHAGTWTWTQLLTQTSAASGGGVANRRLQAWTTWTPASPGSGNFVLTRGANAGGNNEIFVQEILGALGVQQGDSVRGTQAAGSGTLILPAPLVAGSAVVAAYTAISSGSTFDGEMTVEAPPVGYFSNAMSCLAPADEAFGVTVAGTQSFYGWVFGALEILALPELILPQFDRRSRRRRSHRIGVH